MDLAIPGGAAGRQQGKSGILVGAAATPTNPSEAEDGGRDGLGARSESKIMREWWWWMM